ncbi:class I SAM-dependent methyltransferase [Desulfovibrio sp. OttesenSCG-928-G11]|nr:class I SAM-dependent methyltransferase [Desulfovibrio sp. OttesenSCG-928-G11]
MRTNRDSLSGAIRQLTGGCLHPGGLSLTRRALEAAAFAPGSRLLDLGCGGGASLGLLASLGFAAVGLDFCPSQARAALSGACGAAVFPGAAGSPDAPGLCGLAHSPAASVAPVASVNPGAAVVLADMAALPFADAVFDGILCECVLSLAGDKARVLAGCARLLRPGGRLLLCDLALAQRAAATSATGATGQAWPAESGTAPPFCAQGAVSAGQWLGLLKAAGLSPVLLEDHSRALKELAAGLVWQGQSLAALSGLWHNAGMADFAARRGAPEGPAPVRRVPPSATEPASSCRAAPRLGYLLLIAEKREKDHEGSRC